MDVRYYPLTGVPKTIVGGYGPRVYPNGTTKLHDAVDLGAPTGTPVVAVDDGVVRWGTDPVGGNVAILTFADGSAAYMAHLLEVRTGSKRVRAGEQIALCDTTGNAALVGIPHVHWQAWSDGTFAGPHPDPTAALMAAEVLAAPLGVGASRSWATVFFVGVAAASALAIGALAWAEWRNPGALLPWRTV